LGLILMIVIMHKAIAYVISFIDTVISVSLCGGTSCVIRNTSSPSHQFFRSQLQRLADPVPSTAPVKSFPFRSVR